MRRYDIDWIRVFALILLIIYHAVISFMPFGHKAFFIENNEHLEILWILMAMINVWRIPILFMVSGMGVYFAMRRHNWKEFLKDRTVRILLPFIFGFFFICPINLYFLALHHDKDISYVPHSGHLWFLSNIFVYTILLLPIFIYMNKNKENVTQKILSKLFHFRGGIICLSLIPMFETIIIRSEFAIYGNTAHGFWLGFVCFFTGFALVSQENQFWHAIEIARRKNIIIAFFLYLIRLYNIINDNNEIYWLTGFESMCWMLAIFGYGSLYFNKPSNLLRICSEAVYPIYILHLPLQAFFCYKIIPWNMPAFFKLQLILQGIFISSIFLYLIIKRMKWFRPLFGMKI